MKKYFTLLTISLVLSSCQDSKMSDCQVFNNPVVPQRADPWVYKHTDGTYFFIATAPEYDRIELRQSNTINGLGLATPKVVWRKHETGIMGHHIWAPELHRIDGTWYIYFAAGEAENIWNIRMYALSNTADNPMEGEWKEEGRIYSYRDSFSLDATTFEHKGKRYYIWAQNTGKEHSTSLLISEMESPVKLKGPQVVITDPEYDWERVGYNVNEGPSVIKRNGNIFVTYSASATDYNYCIGLLWVDENADLLDTASWNKSPEPVFYTNDTLRRFGPGHSSFTKSEDGQSDVLIYHARVYKEIRGNSLNDINRHTRARILAWDENGFPDFRQDEPD